VRAALYAVNVPMAHAVANASALPRAHSMMLELQLDCNRRALSKQQLCQ
jgi:hypothetical protein